uniref:Protein kinase domain-containing protein n=2 Tax=Oryza TaxID=4527 RepID=A0A0E0FGG3_ORYNI
MAAVENEGLSLNIVVLLLCFGQGKTEAFAELPAKVLIINCAIQIEVQISTAKMIKLRSALGVLEILSVLCISLVAAYTPVDNYLISCGSSVDTPVGQRLFVADDSGTVVLTSPASDAVKASPSAVSGLRDDAAMYQSARVFKAPSSYSFRIRDPGRHFVRLHFFPFVYLGYDLATASFKVSTQDAVLLDGFAPPAAARGNASTTTTTPAAAVCEEFLLDVARDTLVVTFVPLAGRLAFVNAIEVVSVPDDLIGAADSSLSTSDSTGQQLNPAVMPLQTVYRVNVGGPAVAPESDTLWREWTIEQPFLVSTVTTAVTKKVSYNRTLNYLAGQATADDAPAIVYATGRELIIMNGSVFDGMKQMAWQFDVDGSASYLIRFHFCDIVSSVPGRLHMNAYVDSSNAIQDLDLSAIGNGTLAFPYYRDFVLAASTPSGKLAVYVGSTSQKITTPAAILNGLEIMRILTTAGNVAVVEPTTPPGTKKKNNLAVVLGSVCGAFGFVSVAAALVIVLRRKEEKEELRTPTTSQPSTAWMPLLGRISFRSAPPSAVGSRSPSFTIDTNANTPGGGATPGMAAAASSSPSYRFPFAALQDATGNFDEGLVIGEGGFGKVYAAVLQDGTKVAVKRANPESRQGAREFRTEIEMLSGLRHRHLVSLIGYCDEQDEMILLYEYMEHGSLRSRLYGGGAATARATALSWAQRLEACAGAARGLLYLHTATAKPVIHRDVKSSNILLDDGLTAKVADFGLSKAGPDMDETHVSTAVKGSFGYVDPEYVRTRKLTAKSDVYSFGVVLLEALCARPVVDPRLPKPMVNLVEWGLHWQRRDELEKIVDRRIAGTVRPAALRKYGETVARCLADRGADRPAMEDVVWSLQFVARLQEVDGLDASDVSSLNMVHQLMPPTSLHARQRSAGESETGRTDADEDSSVVDDDYTDASMRGIFWQMVNVRGR